MFTGLVQDIGVVEALESQGQSVRLTIATRLAGELREGDSLAVNGVCLTVEAPGARQVVAIAVAETLERTTLGELRARARVHLEPAIKAGEPLGGHIVQGHVDAIAVLTQRRERGPSIELDYRFDGSLMRYVVEKGSIAIDGVSLTVAGIESERFRIATVPHTLEKTLLGAQRAGDRVNVEVDVLAKYVERLLGMSASTTKMTEEWLRRHGY